jgi:hypothetical protein
MEQTLQDFRDLKGIFHDFVKSGTPEQGAVRQEKFNSAMTASFNSLHENLKTGELEEAHCTCGSGDEDDTRGLTNNTTYSLNDFLLDVKFPTNTSAAEGGGASTAGLDDGPTEQYKLNQLEFERQERLLKEYQEALTFTPPSKSSIAPPAA